MKTPARFALSGLVLAAGLCGCGETQKVEPAAPAAAAPAAAPPPAPKGPPPPPSGAPKGGGDAPAKGLTGAQELLQYVPENLTLAAGATFSLLHDAKAHPEGPQLLAHFQPVNALLARGGIKLDQIERLWTGNNRETGDVLVCVRTIKNYEAASVRKDLSCADGSEKIGKATIHLLPEHPLYKNAVAFIDPRTLLIGRYDTVCAALKSPRPGLIRTGFDSLQRPDAYFWIVGDESLESGMASFAAFGPAGPMTLDAERPRSVAFGLSAGTAKSVQFQGVQLQAVRGEGDEEDPNLKRLSGAGAAAIASAVEIVQAMTFATEAQAIGYESKIKQMIKEMQQMITAAMAGAAAASGQRPPGLPPPGPPAAAPNLDQIPLKREKETIHFATSLPAMIMPLVARSMSVAMTASGASAVADGLFDGTLPRVRLSAQQGLFDKPGTTKGVRRVGDSRVTLGYSWMTELLPFIGHGATYSAFDFTRSWIDPQNRPFVVSNVIPEFLNPADPRSTWNGSPEELQGLGLTHFVGMAGIEDNRHVIAAELPRSDPRAGIFGYEQVAKLADVTDGTSQTILLIGSGAVAGPWVQGGGATIRGARAPYFDKNTGFGSKGTGKPGAFVLFADGSARQISADIDPAVFKALCTMHGAEQIDMGKLVSQGRD